MVMMEEGDYFGIGSLAFQSGSCDGSDSFSNTFMSNTDDGSASVATANILLLKKKIISLQSVHDSYEEKNSENQALKVELEKTRKHAVAQSRVCSMLKKQVQMAVGGDSLKAMQDLRKEVAAKTMECEGARNSLAGMQGLLEQMKGAVEYAESKRDEATTKLQSNESVLSRLQAKNDIFQKRFQMVMENKEFQKNEKKEKIVVTKQLRAMERKLEVGKLERDVLTDQLARTGSHLSLTQDQLKKSHAEIEFMKISMDEMRQQLFAGTGLNQSLTSEACRSPVSTGTSPNLVPANASLSAFPKLDVEQDDGDAPTPVPSCMSPRYGTSTPSPVLSTALVQATSPGSATGIACTQRGVTSPPLVKSVASRGVTTRRAAKRSTRKSVRSCKRDLSVSSSDSDESPSPPLVQKPCAPSSPPAPTGHTGRSTIGNTQRSLLGSLDVSSSSSSSSSASSASSSSSSSSDSDSSSEHGPRPALRRNTTVNAVNALNTVNTTVESPCKANVAVESPRKFKVLALTKTSTGLPNGAAIESPRKFKAPTPIKTVVAPLSIRSGVAGVQHGVASPPLVLSHPPRGVKTRRAERSTRQSVLSSLDVSSSSSDSDESSSPPLVRELCAPPPPPRPRAAPAVPGVVTDGLPLGNTRQSLLGSLDVSSSSSSSYSVFRSKHVPSTAHRKSSTVESPRKARVTAESPRKVKVLVPTKTSTALSNSAAIESPRIFKAPTLIKTVVAPPSVSAGVAGVQHGVASPPLVQSHPSRGVKTRRAERSTRQSVLSSLDVSSSSSDSDAPSPAKSAAQAPCTPPSPPAPPAGPAVANDQRIALPSTRHWLIGDLDVSSSDSDSSSKHVPSPAHRKKATAESPCEASAIAPVKATATATPASGIAGDSPSNAAVMSPRDTDMSGSGPASASAAIALQTMLLFGEDSDSGGEDASAARITSGHTSPVKASPLSSPPCKRRNRSVSSTSSARSADLRRIFAEWRDLGDLLSINGAIPDLPHRPPTAAAGCL